MRQSEEYVKLKTENYNIKNKKRKEYNIAQKKIFITRQCTVFSI